MQFPDTSSLKWQLVGQLEGCPIFRSGSIIKFIAKMAIDGDGGGGNRERDKCFQSDTTLHGPDGKPLNARRDRFIVIPPLVRDCVAAILFGSQAWVRDTRNGKWCDAVVGDGGPEHKIGEASIACAVAIGLSGSPLNGGTDRHVIEYVINAGVPAICDGTHYRLQHA